MEDFSTLTHQLNQIKVAFKLFKYISKNEPQRLCDDFQLAARARAKRTTLHALTSSILSTVYIIY